MSLGSQPSRRDCRARACLARARRCSRSAPPTQLSPVGPLLRAPHQRIRPRPATVRQESWTRWRQQVRPRGSSPRSQDPPPGSSTSRRRVVRDAASYRVGR